MPYVLCSDTSIDHFLCGVGAARIYVYQVYAPVPILVPVTYHFFYPRHLFPPLTPFQHRYSLDCFAQPKAAFILFLVRRYSSGRPPIVAVATVIAMHSTSWSSHGQNSQHTEKVPGTAPTQRCPSTVDPVMPVQEAAMSSVAEAEGCAEAGSKLWSLVSALSARFDRSGKLQR